MLRVKLHPANGFTLVEMAVVLIIIGLIMLAVFPGLIAFRSSTQRSVTQSNLKSLMQVTAAYTQANGCLPCPTPATTIGNGFGRVRGDSSASPAACAACPVPEGIPPYMSLGIPASTAHDGGGHWITMRVDPALTINFGITPPTAQCQCSDFTATNLPAGCTTLSAGTATTASCTALGASQKGLCRTGLATTNRISVSTSSGGTQQAAVIFVSHGVNGYGSFYASALSTARGINGARLVFPSPIACSANGGYAECNADGNTQFVDAPNTNSNTDPYDDTLAFADRNALISTLGNSSCQTVW